MNFKEILNQNFNLFAPTKISVIFPRGFSDLGVSGPGIANIPTVMFSKTFEAIRPIDSDDILNHF